MWQPGQDPPGESRPRDVSLSLFVVDDEVNLTAVYDNPQNTRIMGCWPEVQWSLIEDMALLLQGHKNGNSQQQTSKTDKDARACLHVCACVCTDRKA